MQIIYLCRHGETDWSLSGRHTGRTDLPLTAKGEKEAALLVERLKRLHPVRVFSSPLQRALESARGLHPEVDPDLLEWDYGSYEGLTRAEIMKRCPQWNLFLDGAPEGESVEVLKERADRFLDKIRSIKGPIALFSHGHFLRALAVSFLGLELPVGDCLFLSVSSLSALGYDRGKPVLMLWNDTSHL